MLAFLLLTVTFTRDIAPILRALSGRPLPRVWQC